jgi:hypothetical protein
MPEIKREEIETLDKKQSRLDWHMDLSDTWKHWFRDLASELNKKDGNFDKEEVGKAAQKRIDAMIESKGISIKNLSPEEQQRIRDIQDKMLTGMNNMNTPAEMVEEYGKIREKLMWALSASDGKFVTTERGMQIQQEWEQRKEEVKKESWEDSVEQLRNEIQKAIDKRNADKLSRTTTRATEIASNQQAARWELEKWPPDMIS